MDNTSLIHRLSRAQGQIESLKKGLESGQEKDCLKTLQQLKAAQNALKKFAQAFVEQHLDECMQKKLNPQQLQEGLKEVVGASFAL